MSYLACMSLSTTNNLFAKIMLNPSLINEIYIPFLANVKEDCLYQKLWLEGKTFKRWRCKACRNIFVVTEGLEQLKRNCEYCDRSIGFEAE